MRRGINTSDLINNQEFKVVVPGSVEEVNIVTIAVTKEKVSLLNDPSHNFR